METTDLMLAFHVQSMAADLQSKARADHYGSIFDRMDEASRKLAMVDWEKAHPMSTYIDAALLQLHNVAAQIRTYSAS
jgi:hypothetical protein